MTDDSLQRESFEKWYALHWHRNELSERIADDYVFPLVQEKWECWLAALSAQTEARDAKPLNEYHEDMGPVTWWKFPIVEASYIGSPNFDDWPGYHTHFTPHPAIPSNHEEIAQGDL